MTDDSLRSDIRNVAVIAHVDHGKTTLVDAMLRQSGTLKETGALSERVMDSGDLERERGITILAKNTAVDWQGVTINILDTPGHHDFGGEVERMLNMADGVLLLVDAAEGPLPQTRFVMEKALALQLPAVVAINKIDRGDARPAEVLDEVYDLFIELGVDETGIDFPVLFTDGRAGHAHRELGDGSDDLQPLFEAILDTVPPPLNRLDEPFLAQVNNIGWDEYVGRLAILRVLAGTVRAGQDIAVFGERGDPRSARVVRLQRSLGLERVETREASAGDIVTLAGVDEVAIGDTLAADEGATPLPRIEVDEPTLAMTFSINTGPFAGEDGSYVTSRNLRDRLYKEAYINVAIRVDETDTPEAFRVMGRGELQLSILVETMRREGYELMLSRPEVVTREVEGELHEPMERLYVDCEQTLLGAVAELLGPRKASMLDMIPMGQRARVVYRIPTRGLIGLQNDVMNATRGTAVLNTHFDGWTPWQGPIPTRRSGALVADREGHATPYALFGLQPRGVLFVGPGERVYEGMVVGEASRLSDIDVNVTREKKLTNMRAAARDDNVILAPPREITLERCIEFLADDEVVEVTPHHLRMRKRVLAQNRRPKKKTRTE
jgi:GTP-binding protein